MPVGVGAKPAGGTAARPVPAAAKPAMPPTAPPAGAEPGKKGGAKKILLVVLIVVILAVLAVGVFLALKLLGVIGGGGGERESPKPVETTKALVMGKQSVSTGEPLSINLDDGFMSFAATIYFDEEIKPEGEGSSDIDPSPARDAALRLFKGMKKEDLDKPGAMQELQKKYTAELNKSPIPPYNGHVVTVQFTTFAYQ